MTWISAGVAEAGHLEGHCLVRVVAEALEASMGVCRGQIFAGLVGHLSEFFFLITIMIHAFAFNLRTFARGPERLCSKRQVF